MSRRRVLLRGDCDANLDHAFSQRGKRGHLHIVVQGVRVIADEVAIAGL